MTTPDAAPIAEARDLHKTFRDFWRRPRVRAVNGVGFSLHPGEVFGLLGPNGSGKSTIIKMMLGLLYPTEGALEVLGASPRDVTAKSRIGYLPEESWLYPSLTARESLDFYGRLFSLPREERRRRVDQLLEMVGLSHAANRLVGEFSKGMARRIGLAQALINKPDLIILDEPTSGLDPIGCRQVKDLVLDLARHGATVLLSSHLLGDVEDICDRIAILYNGRIRAMGAMGDLLEDREHLRLTLPNLSAEDRKQILALLSERLDADVRADHPRRNLEEYFLEVVARARSSEQDRSGADTGSAAAAFLSESAEREGR